MKITPAADPALNSARFAALIAALTAALISATLLGAAPSAHAECDVSEVVEMVEDDMSTSMIKDACQRSVDVPACSLSKVIRLSRGGESIADIYRGCEEDDEPSPPAPDDSPPPVSNTGLAPGTPIRNCGCWGYVNPGATDMAPQCASGYAQAVGCSGFCPGGGYQWGIRCL